MKFSQRIGKTPATKLAQLESMDDELRACLWSLLHTCYWETAKDCYDKRLSDGDFTMGSSSLSNLIFRLWLDYFKQPTDTIDQYWGNCKIRLRNYFFKAEWYEAYDFVEFVAASGDENVADEFRSHCNQFLERENSAYRFVDGRLTEITSESEIKSVEDAIASGAPFSGVSEHLSAALRLMSDRKSPDFRNSIKESISAVESLAKHVAKKPSASLGEVLKELERTKHLHPALKSAFSALYGYTSDAQGIRHALMDDPTLTKADARLMLVCCSAFVNFIIDARVTQ
jgi:hypothetical protein